MSEEAKVLMEMLKRISKQLENMDKSLFRLAQTQTPSAGRNAYIEIEPLKEE